MEVLATVSETPVPRKRWGPPVSVSETGATRGCKHREGKEPLVHVSKVVSIEKELEPAPIPV